ncbi:MAG: hypothetical protein ACOX24_00290 [Christensenellales bacterium]
MQEQKANKNYAPFVSYQINAQKSKKFPICVGTTITHMYGEGFRRIVILFSTTC